MPERSSVEQVNKAIDIALKILSGEMTELIPQDFSVGRKSVLALFYEETRGQVKEQKELKLIEDVLRPESGRLMKFGIQDYLFESKLERKADGSCGLSGIMHTDASVSEFEIGAAICLSIEKLREHAPNVILPQVIGLLLHEASHLVKKPEDDAMKVQRRAIHFFEGYLKNLHLETTRKNMPRVLKRIVTLATAAEELSRTAPRNPRIFALLGEILEIFRPVEEYASSYWGLDISFEPFRPQLLPNFLLTCIEFFHPFFLMNISPVDERNPAQSSPEMTETEIKKYLSDILEKSNTLLRNWHAFADGSLEPICVKTFLGKDIDPHEFGACENLSKDSPK